VESKLTTQIARNAAWAVTAQLLSLAVGLVALRVLLHALGSARLGIFTLALGFTGFSGLFDLGVGRALTQAVSSGLGAGRSRAQVAALVWRTLPILTMIGVIWFVVLWLAAPWLIARAFGLRDALAAESLLGLRAMALSIPFALAASAALGTLEGLQEFRLLSLWRMPMSVIQFGAPGVMALVRPDVGWVIATLASTRVVWCVLWVGHLSRLLPRARDVRAPWSDMRRLLRFGGWLSVSNLISPLMVYADRFYLASVLPTTQIAYYTVSFDAASRLASLPQVATNVLFPALAEARTRPEESGRLLLLAIRALLSMGLPATLAVAVLAKPALTVWLSPSFAGQASPVLQWIMIGVLVNSVAHIPYVLLQAYGRADLTARFHLMELPLFGVTLVWAVAQMGIVGAAIAWTMRVTLDAALLFAAALALHREIRPNLRTAAQWTIAATALFFLVLFALPDALRGGAVVLLAVVGSLSTWFAFRGDGKKRVGP
jgi:O-antigen/teichoic acid export membrane protein